MKRKVNDLEYHTCLYCGNEIKQRWEEYEPYYECECDDVKKNRRIDEQIRALDYSRPQPKFKFIQEKYVIPLKNNN